MTSTGLQKLAAKWQRALRLNDWTVDVQWNDEDDDKLDGALGACYYSPEHKSAVIVVASPEAHENEHDQIEHTLIHEFLHIRIHGHKVNRVKDYDPQFEFNLNEISSILLEGLKIPRKKK